MVIMGFSRRVDVYKRQESVLGADSTIHSLCKDIVEHYEKYRANLLTGKAMIVAYSRPIAMKIYHELLELRPGWKDKVGVVMTGSNNDPEEWKAIIGTKAYKETLARKFKDCLLYTSYFCLWSGYSRWTLL